MDVNQLIQHLQQVKHKKGRTVKLAVDGKVTSDFHINDDIDTRCYLTNQKPGDHQTKSFYQVSHSEGEDAKIILASTQYEAAGYYLQEEAVTIPSALLDRVKRLSGDHSIHLPDDAPWQNKRPLNELFHELNTWQSPVTVAHLPSIQNGKEGAS